ncbi:hypothetical protein Tco_0440100 [Tanacetum coccineum]
MLGAHSKLSQPLIELWELGLPSWMIAHVGVGFSYGDGFGWMWGANEVDMDRMGVMKVWREINGGDIQCFKHGVRVWAFVTIGPPRTTYGSRDWDITVLMFFHKAYAKIPKLYRAYELYNKNEQLHVFDSEETLEDAEKKLSAEQTYFPSSFISSEKISSETKPSMALMPSANPMLVDLNEMENVFKKLFELLEKNCKRESIFYTSKEELRLIDVCVEAKLILREWHVYFEVFHNRLKRDVKEMKDIFVSVENDLDKTFKQNKLLKDQLLEASLAEDVKNLVITSCMEIRNTDLHDETERISQESKDVSNKSKTADTVCNDAFEVTQELSKRIVELEKDLSRVETNECDEVKVKVDFDEIETKNIKLEHRVMSLIKENEHLKLTYQSLFDSIKRSRVQTKTSNVTQNEAENLKFQLFKFAKTKFNNIFEKIEFFKKKQLDISELNKESGKKQNLYENEISVFQIKIDELEKKGETLGKSNAFDKENYDFESKVIHLEKIIAQKSKDFDDVNLELSNITAKFEVRKDQFLKEINQLRTQLENLKGKRVETKFDNSLILGKPSLLNNERGQLLKQIASLESKLASQDIRSCQKEYHELRTSYNALKVKFDSLSRKNGTSMFQNLQNLNKVFWKRFTRVNPQNVFKKGFSVYNLFFTKR